MTLYVQNPDAAQIAETRRAVDEARRDIASAVKTAPNNPANLLTSAIVHELGGNRQLALDDLGKALRQGLSLHEARNIAALSRLFNDPRYPDLVEQLGRDPSYQRRDMTYVASEDCPDWKEPGGGLRTRQ